MPGKYLIRNATAVTVDGKLGTIPNCDILIEDGIIAAVGPSLSVQGDATVIDGTDSIVSPGFVDTHRHTWQTQLRTVTTDYVLSDYALNIRTIYGSCYTPHDAYMGNLCGALESIDNGITYLVDHSHIMNSPEHADAAIKGLRDSKIRAVFCYGLYDNPSWEGSAIDESFNAKDSDWRLADAKRVREAQFPSNKPTDLVRFGFAPTEMELTTFDRTVHEIEYGRSLEAAVITGHVGIGKYDIGQHLVQKLEGKKLLGSDLLLSHCASLQDSELRAVRNSGVSLSSTPDTELQMGMGHPIAFKACQHGCIASIGIDITSNNPADMFQQMRLLLQAQRHKENEAHVGPLPSVAQKCYQVLRMATMGGAEAVGLKNVIGSITPGKRADLLITRCDSTRLTPVHDPVGALVLYANASDIDTVFIDGEVVKNKGVLTGSDWPAVRSDLRDSARAIMERAARAPRAELQQRAERIVKGNQLDPGVIQTKV
ncbi:hypothetical protein PMZ80_003974 [Knufia obscura]|uniref:Amidohydrolase-related domain-containing protein n=2 Tax=Knufia TaxID=430999 RepID=A0AAN8EIK6_9EURO|nr:hypothetical protein PMZ80_003974 [Knufia obscura]KAK5952298.1 hypothetical protein OHC33_006771 [Knufia fluminis]